MNPAYCPNCASDIGADAATCGRCGALFGAGSAFQPVSEKPTNPAFVAPPPAEGKRGAGPVPWGIIGAVMMFLSLASCFNQPSDPVSLLQRSIGTPRENATIIVAGQFLLFVFGAAFVFMSIVRRLLRRDQAKR